MDKKLRLEILKFEYSIIKDKLLLFAAGAGGSFTFVFTKELPKAVDVGLYVLFAISTVGLLLNLQKAGKIQIEIKKLKEVPND